MKQSIYKGTRASLPVKIDSVHNMDPGRQSAIYSNQYRTIYSIKLRKPNNTPVAICSKPPELVISLIFFLDLQVNQKKSNMYT